MHLSKESVTEWELIFARAGLFDEEDSVMAKHEHKPGGIFCREMFIFSLWVSEHGEP